MDTSVETLVRESEKQRIEQAKKLLRNVVEFINYDDSVSRNVWDILTALRGPDNNNDVLKELTTCRLRFKLGFKEGDSLGFIVNSDGVPLAPALEAVKNRYGVGAVSIHFQGHFDKAIQAVGKLQI